MFEIKNYTGPKKKPEYNPIRRYRANPTIGNAVKAMCATCMGCTDTEMEPGVRESIRDCTSSACPLHSHRPYQGKASAKPDFVPLPVVYATRSG